MQRDRGSSSRPPDDGTRPPDQPLGDLGRGRERQDRLREVLRPVAPSSAVARGERVRPRGEGGE